MKGTKEQDVIRIHGQLQTEFKYINYLPTFTLLYTFSRFQDLLKFEYQR